MSAPRVTAITPAANDTDIVLGSPVTVTFDQAVDPSTVSNATFIVFGPGETGVMLPDQWLANDPKIVKGREYIAGTFTFPSPNHVLFTPSVPFRPNTKYTILLAGAGAIVVKNSIKNLVGEAMAGSLQTTFTTGVIDQSAVPLASPVPWEDPATQAWERPQIDPDSVTVTPIESQGNDLSQQIVLTFPADIDPSTFALSDVSCEVLGISNDPLIQIPQGLNYSVQVSGNKLIVSVGNWPTPPPPPLNLPPAPNEQTFQDGVTYLNSGSGTFPM